LSVNLKNGVERIERERGWNKPPKKSKYKGGKGEISKFALGMHALTIVFQKEAEVWYELKTNVADEM
jgi:hypothetical protein